MIKKLFNFLKNYFKQNPAAPVLFTPFLINWTSQNTTDLMANITGIITDLTPLLLIIVGIGVALIVFAGIISAIRGH
jgi:hypothetical protein